MILNKCTESKYYSIRIGRQLIYNSYDHRDKFISHNGKDGSSYKNVKQYNPEEYETKGCCPTCEITYFLLHSFSFSTITPNTLIVYISFALC